MEGERERGKEWREGEREEGREGGKETAFPPHQNHSNSKTHLARAHV